MRHLFRVLGSGIEIVRVSPSPVQRSRPPATAEPFVGRAMRRTEDRRFVTGRGCYVDDFIRPGLTHAVLVRSAHAHALPLSPATITQWIREAQRGG